MANDQLSDQLNNIGNVVKDNLDTMSNNIGNFANTAADAILDAAPPSTFPTPTIDLSAGNSAVDVPTAVAAGGSYHLNESNLPGWIALYVVTIVVAVLGNLLFIVSCLCTKRTRTTGYYLLINLSIRDILLAGLCVPFTLDSEILSLTWRLGDDFCIAYRYFYYCFLFFLPLTLVFLAWHLFVENCKWNFAGEEGAVPRPWPHTIYLPLIWFFSAAFAVPTVFWTDIQPIEKDIYRNEHPDLNSLTMANFDRSERKVCMHNIAEGWVQGSDMFYITSTLVTFCLPVIMLFIPWLALLIQICGCCTRRLRSSEFWLSIITLFMVLFFEASRAPFELFNFHHILTTWTGVGPIAPPAQFPDTEVYKAVMKWAVYAPALLHPLLYFTFSPEARHGCAVLFSRLCSCCCSKSGSDVEVASDDEKGQMLNDRHGNDMDGHAGGHMDMDQANVPLQSKQEDEM